MTGKEKSCSESVQKETHSISYITRTTSVKSGVRGSEGDDATRDRLRDAEGN